ncbi:MAG: hypothetical protein HYU55_00365 [Nocardioides sp.]|nr:hypothetical protein [Nocardioides sp.]
MKTLLAGIGTAALLSGGLVAGVATSAEAAPYPGTVATNCHVNVKSHSASKGTRVVVWVSAAGDGEPKGRASVSVERRKGGDRASDSGWISGGDRLTLNLGKLRRGVYDGSFNFNSQPAKSVYKNCSEGFSFRVTR